MPSSVNDSLYQDITTRRDISIQLAIMALNMGHDDEFERYKIAAAYLQESLNKVLEMEIGA